MRLVDRSSPDTLRDPAGECAAGRDSNEQQHHAYGRGPQVPEDRDSRGGSLLGGHPSTAIHPAASSESALVRNEDHWRKSLTPETLGLQLARPIPSYFKI